MVRLINSLDLENRSLNKKGNGSALSSKVAQVLEHRAKAKSPRFEIIYGVISLMPYSCTKRSKKRGEDRNEKHSIKTPE